MMFENKIFANQFRECGVWERKNLKNTAFVFTDAQRKIEKRAIVRRRRRRGTPMLQRKAFKNGLDEV